MRYIYRVGQWGYCTSEIEIPSSWYDLGTRHCSLDGDHPGPHMEIKDGLIKAMWVDESEGGE